MHARLLETAVQKHSYPDALALLLVGGDGELAGELGLLNRGKWGV